MNLWILDGSEHNVLSGQRTYETNRLLDEASLMPFTTVRYVHMVQINAESLVAGELRIDDRPMSVFPDLVVPRALSLETDPRQTVILNALEYMGAFCMNSSRSIEHVSNKISMGNTMVQWGIPYPQTVPLKEKEDFVTASQILGWPLIVKQAYGTRGTGVAMCKMLSEFMSAVDSFLQKDPQNPLLAQKFVAASYGRDVRAFVVGDRVVASMLRQAANPEEFRSNYSLGGKVGAFDLSAQHQRLAVGAAQALALDYAGVDLLFSGHDQFTICEVNRTPDFKGLEAAFSDRNVAKTILDFGVQLCHANQSKQKKEERPAQDAYVLSPSCASC